MRKCKNCDVKLQKFGYHYNRKGKIQKYKCLNCGAITLGETLESFG